ncbi:MAG: cytochrome c [Candidatus Latescibacteria bacterium]|jgi:high-affinity iron transporter|nr:cytochrome c [Candidatus Latescibacterota bacterium]
MSRLYIVALFCILTACQNAPEQKPEPQPQQITAETIQKGQDLYKRYGCAVCHGRNGHGNGQIARTLNPRPRDFHDSKTYKNGRSIEAVSRTILKGALNERGMGMPGYPQIREEERKTIATFIVSLQQAQ